MPTPARISRSTLLPKSGLFIQWAGRVQRVVIEAVLVLMEWGQVARLDEANRSQRAGALPDRNLERKRFAGFRQRAFVPSVEKVMARRNTRNGDASRAVRDRIIRRAQNNDHGAHFGVDVAEDIANPRAV